MRVCATPFLLALVLCECLQAQVQQTPAQALERRAAKKHLDKIAEPFGKYGPCPDCKGARGSREIVTEEHPHGFGKSIEQRGGRWKPCTRCNGRGRISIYPTADNALSTYVEYLNTAAGYVKTVDFDKKTATEIAKNLQMWRAYLRSSTALDSVARKIVSSAGNDGALVACTAVLRSDMITLGDGLRVVICAPRDFDAEFQAACAELANTPLLQGAASVPIVYHGPPIFDRHLEFLLSVPENEHWFRGTQLWVVGNASEFRPIERLEGQRRECRLVRALPDAMCPERLFVP